MKITVQLDTQRYGKNEFDLWFALPEYKVQHDPALIARLEEAASEVLTNERQALVTSG